MLSAVKTYPQLFCIYILPAVPVGRRKQLHFSSSFKERSRRRAVFSRWWVVLFKKSVLEAASIKNREIFSGAEQRATSGTLRAAAHLEDSQPGGEPEGDTVGRGRPADCTVHNSSAQA